MKLNSSPDFIIEPKRKIPVKRRSDVLVVGAGPAGFSAAINASKEGVDTVLIEQAGAVGGIATIGLMSHWTGNTQGGFYEEIIERSMDCFKDDGTMIGGWHTINTEKLKTTMLQMLDEAGVELHLYRFASNIVMEENKVKGDLAV